MLWLNLPRTQKCPSASGQHSLQKGVCGGWRGGGVGVWGTRVAGRTPATPSGELCCCQSNVCFGLAKTSCALVSALSLLMTDHSFCHTGLEDHLHGFLRTCKGSCVHSKMPEFVLHAKYRSMLYLWQRIDREKDEADWQSVGSTAPLSAQQRWTLILCRLLFIDNAVQCKSSRKASVLYIPMCWGPHSYWASRLSSQGCCQGLLAGCSLWHCTTAGAARGDTLNSSRAWVELVFY